MSHPRENQQCGFRTGPTQIGLYKHRRWLETGNCGFRKKRNCTIGVAKTKVLISFAVTAKLISAFVFAYADCWFSHEAAQMSVILKCSKNARSCCLVTIKVVERQMIVLCNKTFVNCFLIIHCI